MKTVSQLGSGKQPVGTTAYMGQVSDLMQCQCAVQRGNPLFTEPFLSFYYLLVFSYPERLKQYTPSLIIYISDGHIGVPSSFRLGLYHMNCCLNCSFIRWLKKLLYPKRINLLSLRHV